MEMKELFESRPQEHADLAEVAIQSGAALLSEVLLVAFVNG